MNCTAITIGRLLLASALLPHLAWAQSEMMFCTEPRVPYCLDAIHSDADDLRRCQPEVDAYKNDMTRYLACVDDARRQAVERGNRTIEQWNELVRRFR